MDSKQLYRKFYSKFDLAKWLDEKDELADESSVKYDYCGTKEYFKKEFVKEELEKYFINDEIYLIITSGNSSLVSKSEITDRIENFIGKKEIGIIDKEFSKLIFFDSYGTFKKGLVIEYPKSRIKEEGTALNAEFFANIYEASTERIVRAVEEPFDKLGKELSNDYGGNIEHLWISLELVENHLKEGVALPFRFQKRVTLSGFGLPGKDYCYNVGSYSVTPDFEKLKILPEEKICDYVLGLIYESTQILIDTKKKLNDFKAEQFRADFIAVCKKNGYLIEESKNNWL